MDVRPRARLLGLFEGRFALVETAERTLVCLDGQAAEQALALEAMREALRSSGQVRAAPLLIPSRFACAGLEDSAAVDVCARLLTLGFEVEPFGPETFVLKSAPDALGALDTPKLVELAVRGLRSASRSFDPERFLEEAARVIEVTSLDEPRALRLFERTRQVFETSASPIRFERAWSAEGLASLIGEP